MKPYFEKMPGFGKALKENRVARMKESRAKLEAVEAEIAAARKAAENVGIPTAKINERGWLTVWQHTRAIGTTASFRTTSFMAAPAAPLSSR